MKTSFSILVVWICLSMIGHSQNTTKVAIPKVVRPDSLISVKFLSTEDSVYSSSNGRDTLLFTKNMIVHRVPRGNHAFFFRKTGFDDLVLPLAVSDSCIIPLRLTSRKKVPKDQPPQLCVVRILSEPKGARIILDSAIIGTTPY